jgi:2-polyprenyl-3-methyl-5-hydroxy-6-metoxy-1,4-benzoquinol methylase
LAFGYCRFQTTTKPYPGKKMKNLIDDIIREIDQKNPLHGKKLKKNRAGFDQVYFTRANQFLNSYETYLLQNNKSIDYAINCYLQMIDDIVSETVRFLETGKYSCTTFAEVNKRVYNNPQIMEYYMQGILLSQFLWKHHYANFKLFTDNLPRFQNTVSRYLEIGGGHGLFISEAIKVFNSNTVFDLVDISPTSIEMAKQFVNNSKIRYTLTDVFEYSPTEKYDFITMGEVLEHVENPLALLMRLNEFLNANGVLFITVPVNGPTIDHIYLFNSVDEIRQMLSQSNFKVILDLITLAEDVDQETAERFKITSEYAVFLQKSN